MSLGEEAYKFTKFGPFHPSNLAPPIKKDRVKEWGSICEVFTTLCQLVCPSLKHLIPLCLPGLSIKNKQKLSTNANWYWIQTEKTFLQMRASLLYWYVWKVLFSRSVLEWLGPTLCVILDLFITCVSVHEGMFVTYFGASVHEMCLGGKTLTRTGRNVSRNTSNRCAKEDLLPFQGTTQGDSKQAG